MDEPLPEPTMAPGLEPQPVAGFLPPYEQDLPEPSPAPGHDLQPPPESDGLEDLLGEIGVIPGQEQPAPPPMEPEELQISCHACGEMMELTITERPVTIECWNCGTQGLIE